MHITNNIYRYLLLLLLSFFLFNHAISDELKKINEDLSNIKNLYDSGVLDEDSYNSAKKKLDDQKKNLIAKKNSLNSNSNSKDSIALQKQIQILEKLYKEGTLSEDEYLKTKKFLIDKEEKGQNVNLDKLKQIYEYKLNITKTPGNKNWEKAEIIYKNYKIYTHRPGGITIIRISDNKKLLRISDNYKIKYYNDGENLIKIKKTVYKPIGLSEAIENAGSQVGKTLTDIFEVIKDPLKKRNKELFDTDTHKLEVFIDGNRILHYVGRYVKQHQAFFYQVLTDRSEPFHFYIKIGGKAAIALNMKFFNAKIDRAVRKAKKELSIEYNISEEEIQKIIDEKVGEETNKAIERTMENAINESVKEAIRQTIGQELSNMLVTAVEQATGEAIDSAIEKELADAIDQEIARAVAMGIDEAAVSAGWEAYFEVLAQGGTVEEASAAAYEACGSACDNY